MYNYSVEAEERYFFNPALTILSIMFAKSPSAKSKNYTKYDEQTLSNISKFGDQALKSLRKEVDENRFLDQAK